MDGIIIGIVLLEGLCYDIGIEGGSKRGGHGLILLWIVLVLDSVGREEGGGVGTGGKARGGFEVGHGCVLLWDNISIGYASNILY